MGAGDFQVRYNDFKGGEAGLRDPSQWNRDQWSGTNMQVYRSGLLGVRAGTRQLPITGAPNMGTGGPVGFGVFVAADGTTSLLLASVNTNRVHTVPVAGGAAVALPTYPAIPSPLINGEIVRFVTGNDKLYSLVTQGTLGGLEGLFRHDPGATVAITTPVPFERIVRWGLWMVAVPADNPQKHRLYFNKVDAAGPDYDTWPANNFYDVGNTEPITALEPVFNTLYVGKPGGWHAVTGVLGDLASIRDVAVGGGPETDLRSVVAADNRAYYIDRDGIPAVFNGADPPSRFEEQRRSPYVPPRLDAVAATSTGGKVVMMDSAGFLLLDGRTWTKQARSIFSAHQFVGLAPVGARDGWNMPPGVVYFTHNDTSPGVISTWKHDLDRPGHSSDQFANYQDWDASGLVPGTVSLPAYYEPNGKQVLVRRVTVQFRKWPSGSSTTNTLRLRVDALGAWNFGTVASTIESWSESSTLAPATGADDSVRLDFGEQGYGNGFQIVFEVVQGVAIREVVVDCEIVRGR